MACGEQQRRSHSSPQTTHWEVRVQVDNFWARHYFQGNPVSLNYFEAKIGKDVNIMNT